MDLPWALVSSSSYSEAKLFREKQHDVEFFLLPEASCEGIHDPDTTTRQPILVLEHRCHSKSMPRDAQQSSCRAGVVQAMDFGAIVSLVLAFYPSQSLGPPRSP